MISLDKVKGVGPKATMLLNKLGIQNVDDLVSHYPFRYDLITRSNLEESNEMDKVIMDLPVKPENAKKVLDVLYDEPIVSRKKIIEKTGIKFTTLVGVINAFQEKQILIETTGYSRNQVFAFQKYIDLFLK